MSSTNRSSSRDLHISDYYVTPQLAIKQFWAKFTEIESKRLEKSIDIFQKVKYLDPASGGCSKHEMSYPAALKTFGINCDTIDIREDSLAQIKGDYLKLDCKNKYHVIITNPPFLIAQEIVEKAIEDVKERGYVIMLLRLNFWGSKKRRGFWSKYYPLYSFIHSERMSFTDDGKSDSIEYMHSVWRKDINPEYCRTILI